jgi:hypothetical protein
MAAQAAEGPRAWTELGADDFLDRVVTQSRIMLS